MNRSSVVLVALAACGSVADQGKKDAAMQMVDSRTVDARDIDAFTCAPTPSNLNGRWRGENNANDDSGNAYNGTTVGTFAYTAGKHGQAFLFDGSSNEVKINDGDALWPAAAFSMELWLKTTSTTSATLMQKYQCAAACPSGSFALFEIRIATGGHPSFDLRTDSTDTATNLQDTTHVLSDGNWHHVVGVRDTTMMRLYLDGMEVASVAPSAMNLGAMTNTDSETDPVTLGAGTVGGTSTAVDFFAGALDEVAFYKTALTATQVAQLYAAPQGPCQ